MTPWTHMLAFVATALSCTTPLDAHRPEPRDCYASCTTLRNDCIRRYLHGANTWPWTRHGRTNRRFVWDDAYRTCERRFDLCIDACRDRRWNE